MKMRNFAQIGRNAFINVVAILLPLAASQQTRAASQTWTGGGANGNWSTILNWNGAVPGATSGGTSTDVATFNAAIANTWGNVGTPIIIDSGRNIKSLTFDTSVGNYYIGSTGLNALKLTSGGTISLASTIIGVNVTETINAPLTFQGSYTFNNARADAGSALVFGGTISNAATSTLTLSGAGTGTGNLISGALNDGTGVQSLTITTTAGKWTLSGANNYSGLTSITGGGGTTVFQGSNSSAGQTTLSGASAAVQLDSASNGGLASGLFTFTQGTVEALNATRTLANNFSVASGGSHQVVFQGSQSIVINGKVTGTSGAARSFDNNITGTGKTLTLNNVDINTDISTARALTFAGTGSTLVTGTVANGNSSIAQGITISTTGGGAVTLSGSNTYSGVTTVSAAGVLNINSTNALGSGTLSLASLAVIDNTSGAAITNAVSNLIALNGQFTFSGSNDLNLGPGQATNANSAVITMNGTGKTLTFGGLYQNLSSKNLTANGAGNTLVLAGGYAINSGSANSSSTIGGSANINISGNIVDGGGSTASPLTFDTTGVITLGGSITYGGTMTINNTSAVNLTGTMNGPTSVTVNNAAASLNESSAGTIQGASTTFTTSGSATLAGNNSYGGLTTVSAGGTLCISNNNALGTIAGSTTVSSGAALQLEGNIAIGAEALSLTGTGVSNNGALRNMQDANSYAGAITLGTGGARINSDVGTLTLSGGISGAIKPLTVGGSGNVTISGGIGTTSGTLTKDGAGMLRIFDVNTITGAASVSNGTLVVNGTLSNATVEVTGGATQGTLGGTGTLVGAITVDSGATLAPGDPNVNNGVGTLTIKTLTLNSGSTNNFQLIDQTTGDKVVVTTTLNNLTGVHFNLYQTNGAAFGTAGTYTLMTYVGTAPSVSGLTVDNLPVGLQATFPPPSAGNVQVTLSGTGATWAGLGADANWQTSANWLSGIPSEGASLTFIASGNWPINTNNLLNAVGGITFSNGASAFQLGGQITLKLQGNIVNLGTAQQTLTMPLRLDMADRTINASAGDLLVSGAIDDNSTTLGVTKIGTNKLTLSGNNSFGGAVTISNGTVNIQHPNALGNTTGGTTVSNGAALQIQNSITTAAEPLTLNGAGVSSDGALRNIQDVNTYAGAITLGSGSRINSDAGTLTLSGGISGATQPLAIGGSGNVTISGAIGTTSGTLTKDGGGTLILGVASTYTGLTTINGGVVNVRNATGLGTTAGGVTVASGAALQLQGTITIGAEALTLNGSGVSNDGALRNMQDVNSYAGGITLGVGGARINSDAGTLTLSGGISGATQPLTIGGSGNVTISGAIGTTSGTLTKDGGGTLILGVASTYTGRQRRGVAVAGNHCDRRRSALSYRHRRIE
jgi:fibronectin-binding autotransporter adhesin